MKPSKKIGIREIAKLADVSTATVSMVLNNNAKITDATRQRVQKVMEQTGYRPNRIAQSLSSKYTRTLAVLLPTLRRALADPYFGELISGICDRANRLGHKVLLEQAKPEFVRERRHVELLERRFVDGVLCLGFNDRHGFLRDFAAAGHPMVAVNSSFPDWGLNHVVSDYASGAEQVMTYLLQLGHTKIGMVHGSPDIATSRTLVDVFVRRMTVAAAGFDESWLEDGKFTEEFGDEAAGRLLETHPDLTAIFAGNDKMALGVIRHLRRTGRDVPGDVSVIGFDDIPYAAFLSPTLSTVHVPLYELGAAACEQVVELIRGKTKSVAQVLPTHLVLRESTGRPRADAAST
jgi:DNA-binding LacI/PurR family transcriptional regulator